MFSLLRWTAGMLCQGEARILRGSTFDFYWLGNPFFFQVKREGTEMLKRWLSLKSHIETSDEV